MVGSVKKYKCKKCGFEVVIRSKGLCPSCYNKEKYIKNNYKKNKEGSELTKFYDRHITYCKKSDNSDSPIHNPTRSNICHIFPKRIYKSLATDDLNIVYLKMDEHTQFDYLLDTLDLDRLELEMPVLWGVVKDKVKILLERCLEKQKLFFNFEEKLS